MKFTIIVYLFGVHPASGTNIARHKMNNPLNGPGNAHDISSAYAKLRLFGAGSRGTQ